METEGLADGSEFYISTGGNPLHVKVGTPDNKTARRTVNQISVQIIKQLLIVLELSLNRTKQMMAVLRKGMGTATAIESNIFGKLQQIEDTFQDFTKFRRYIIISNHSINHIINHAINQSSYFFLVKKL